MQCPVCDVTLSISSREGVEIDFCPQCRGVWLDRGELDKVIERAGAVIAAAPRPAPAEPRRERYEERDRDDRYERGRERYDDDDRHRGRPKKKKGIDFLEDLFDF
jgi:Zn-finger nucleic acid-binding protein